MWEEKQYENGRRSSAILAMIARTCAAREPVTFSESVLQDVEAVHALSPLRLSQADSDDLVRHHESHI